MTFLIFASRSLTFVHRSPEYFRPPDVSQWHLGHKPTPRSSGFFLAVARTHCEVLVLLGTEILARVGNPGFVRNVNPGFVGNGNLLLLGTEIQVLLGTEIRILLGTEIWFC